MRKSFGLKGFQAPRSALAPSAGPLALGLCSNQAQGGIHDTEDRKSHLEINKTVNGGDAAVSKEPFLGSLDDLIKDENEDDVRKDALSMNLSSSSQSKVIGSFVRPCLQKLPSTNASTADLIKSSATNPPLCFSILFTKRSSKKRKCYSDGVLVVYLDTGRADMFDTEGGKVTSTKLRVDAELKKMGEGSKLDVGAYELEIGKTMNYVEEVRSGKAFLASSVSAATTAVAPVVSTFKRPTATGSLGLSKETALARVNAQTETRTVLLEGVHGQEPFYLDPFLARIMRPHQVQGVIFLLNCISGTRASKQMGCVLADDMGLGKTLQSLAMIWTALKQPRTKPLCQKCVIVCPASLVGNWLREFNKFLGPVRLRPLAVLKAEDAQVKIREFASSVTRPCLIISYESYRKFASELNVIKGLDLIICDEGHRLKSSGGNKTVEALSRVPTGRRVILTGTPLQNHLDEFYSLISFVNPGALGTDARHFKRVFQAPIEKGSDKSATKEESLIAEARSKELFSLTSQFVLRRTSEILAKSLPEKIETCCFVRLGSDQREAYLSFLSALRPEDGSAGSDALRLISRLKQICTFPPSDNTPSTKLEFLMRLVERALEVGDKFVLVSNFTSLLDVVHAMLSRRSIASCRLDGATKISDRQAIVNRFNAPDSPLKVFLLSSKAGGCGLNLIGANRLCLIDPDWNPAVDAQAMARVWREGQTKPVFVYRLFATGTIEEKILQRQLMKTSTSRGVITSGISKSFSAQGAFSWTELRKLFELNEDTECETFPVLATSSARHDEKDSVLQRTRSEVGETILTFLHSNSSTDPAAEEEIKRGSADEDDSAEDIEWDGDQNDDDELLEVDPPDSEEEASSYECRESENCGINKRGRVFVAEEEDDVEDEEEAELL